MYCPVSPIAFGAPQGRDLSGCSGALDVKPDRLPNPAEVPVSDVTLVSHCLVSKGTQAPAGGHSPTLVCAPSPSFLPFRLRALCAE